MTLPEVVEVDSLEFWRYVRQGDMVTWGQACAEPVPLTMRLLAQRREIGHFRCFLGVSLAGTVRPEHTDVVAFVSYCGSGDNRALAQESLLDVLPIHYSEIPAALGHGPLAVDVVLLQLAPADASGRFSLGLADEYLSASLEGARVVIAEVNDQMPRVSGARHLRIDDLDVIVPTSRPPVPMPPVVPTATDRRIAVHVAGLVDDGATLQFGLGRVPRAVMSELVSRRDLGVHSGVIHDEVVDLVEAGAITGARKSLDPGIAVAGVLMGTDRLFAYADENPAIQIRDSGYTHGAAVLAAQARFVAINSAIEVDLTGQVNTEMVDDLYVGAVGGIVDFVRGAHRSEGGVPIIALPATAGGKSRVVPELRGPVSIARSDAGVVVTQYGVADLRGQPLARRRELMLAIAEPAHREALADSPWV